MRVLVVGNQKGGVGKTTLTIHLAFHAAAHGHRVLAVDLDEGDLHQGMAPDTEIDGAVLCATALFHLESMQGTPIQVSENVDLIPADVGLLDVDDQPIEIVMNLRRQLERLAPRYDVCVIDTPPNLQRRMIAALVSADALVSPMGVDPFSLARMPKLMNTVNTVREEYNPALRMLGFLPNRVNTRSRQEREALPELYEHFGDQIFRTPLTERAVVRSAASAGVSVWSHARTGNARVAQAEMQAACDAIYKRLLAEG